MNESELENLTERTVERQNADSIGQAIRDLNLSATQSIVVTLGSKGVYVHANQKGQFIDGHKVEALDTTGSGDCFMMEAFQLEELKVKFMKLIKYALLINLFLLFGCTNESGIEEDNLHKHTYRGYLENSQGRWIDLSSQMAFDARCLI